MEIELTVNGFTDTVLFDDTEVQSLHQPIMDLIQLKANTVENRLVVLLAAPPGTGKSTLAAFWAWLCKQDSSNLDIQPLSMDGFHYPNSYLTSHYVVPDKKSILLKTIKGAPETYDVSSLNEALTHIKQSPQGKWSIYDRNIHDPIKDAITVTAPIVIVEGNWVLLDDPQWVCLSQVADLKIFVEADEAALKDRLVQRKLRGGYPLHEVEAHYERSDKINIQKVLSNRVTADITLKLVIEDQSQKLILLNNIEHIEIEEVSNG